VIVRGVAGVPSHGGYLARSSEQELRQKLIEARAVDVMVAVVPKMFYAVTLPRTLWFFDRSKANTRRADTVLFIDARHIYRQADRAHRHWTATQISFTALGQRQSTARLFDPGTILMAIYGSPTVGVMRYGRSTRSGSRWGFPHDTFELRGIFCCR